MHVIRFGIDHIGCNLGDIREGLILRGSDRARLTVTSGLLVCLLCPLTRNDIIRLAASRHQVHRHHRKLCGSTALKEEHFIMIGNIHDIAQIFFCCVDNRLIFLGTMRHLHHGLTRFAIFEQLCRRRLQNLLGKHRGTCTEIVYSCHKISSFCMSTKIYSLLYTKIQCLSISFLHFPYEKIAFFFCSQCTRVNCLYAFFQILSAKCEHFVNKSHFCIIFFFFCVCLNGKAKIVIVPNPFL